MWTLAAQKFDSPVLDKGNLIYLDFSKPSDTASTLLIKLEKIRISRRIVKWVRTKMKERQQGEVLVWRH